MIRKGRKYALEEVLSCVEPKGCMKARMEFDGDFIKITSDRLFVFKQSHICCECGIVGRFFVKEKSSPKDVSFHMSLYAIDNNGDERLMTKDHIVPKSLGGKNHPSNYRTLCVKCNLEKGNGIQRGTYSSPTKMGESIRGEESKV